MTAHGTFVWFDLLTTDPAAATAFYTDLIGWKTEPFGDEYTMFVGEQGPLAGAEHLPEDAKKRGAPPQWRSNVYVDDVDAAAAKAVELGGRILVAPKDYPPVGRLAVIMDPQGTGINLFKPTQTRPLHDATKPGEMTWCELLANDHVAAFAFYSALFGWKKVRDFDMGRELGSYLVYSYAEGGREIGGMFTKGKDMPMKPTWFHYIHVANVDATVDRAKASGAKLMNGPMDVPGGGRIAQLTDPQGAIFALHAD